MALLCHCGELLGNSSFFQRRRGFPLSLSSFSLPLSPPPLSLSFADSLFLSLFLCLSLVLSLSLSLSLSLALTLSSFLSCSPSPLCLSFSHPPTLSLSLSLSLSHYFITCRSVNFPGLFCRTSLPWHNIILQSRGEFPFFFFNFLFEERKSWKWRELGSNHRSQYVTNPAAWKVVAQTT